MTKSQRHEAIRERAADAIRNLYHNATISYPQLADTSPYYDQFESWLQDACEQEIDYLASGGAYGTNYRATLAAPCNAGRYKSTRAREYYIRAGMHKQREERADCGVLTGWRVLELAAGNKRLAHRLQKTFPKQELTRNDSMWERIRDYGKLYSYGRGGRTLAPDELVRTGGGSTFSMREDYCAERSIADCITLIRIVESFNRYVAAWCAGVPGMWADYVRDMQADERAERKAARLAKAKETRERNYWAARGVRTV